MPSSKDYLYYVLDQLSDLDNITYRYMMSEYIIYHNNIVIGGIYDDRFLVKQTNATNKIIPNATLELPYEGGKEMVLVDIDDRNLLNELIPLISEELKSKKK